MRKRKGKKYHQRKLIRSRKTKQKGKGIKDMIDYLGMVKDIQKKTGLKLRFPKALLTPF